MNRNDVALTIYAALLGNGRDPTNSLDQAFAFADRFLVKLEDIKSSEKSSQRKPRKKE